MTTFFTGEEYVNVDGMIVEKDALNVHEAIVEYDPNLRIICADPHTAKISDAPFILVEQGKDGIWRRVFEVWKLDASVLQRIEAADTTRHDVQAKIDKINADAKGQWHERYKEKRGIFSDLMLTGLKNRKSSFSYKHPETGELKTIYDDGRHRLNASFRNS